MSQDANSLIKRDDFVELKYLVIVSNSTTKTEVKALTPITITEFREKGLVLRLPTGACTTGHMLLLQILPKTNLVPKQRQQGQAPASGPGAKRPAKSHDQLAKEKELAHREFLAAAIEITAKTNLVLVTDDGSLLVEVTFYQFNEKKWHDFTKSFEVRQDNIHALIKTIKE